MKFFSKRQSEFLTFFILIVEVYKLCNFQFIKLPENQAGEKMGNTFRQLARVGVWSCSKPRTAWHSRSVESRVDLHESKEKLHQRHEEELHAPEPRAIDGESGA